MAEKKTLVAQLEELASAICDEYCRFPREWQCEDELMEYCEKCPITEVLG